jgi:2-dehydro-3-deoxyphosphooctonate aldolase (KDO 8-P synthase)
MQDAEVAIGPVTLGNRLPLALIAGPCQMESRAHALETASALKEIAARRGLGLIYKSSYDKANRTSAKAARGIGMDKALEVFAEIRETFGLPVLTDVHEVTHCAPVGEAVDVLQIPAFLCRQTDLLLAAGATGRVVNIKKGQFLAPWDMKNAADKVTGAGNPRVLLTGARHRPAHRVRRDPFGAAAGRAGHLLGRAARIRGDAGARGSGRGRRGRLHRDP